MISKKIVISSLLIISSILFNGCSYSEEIQSKKRLILKDKPNLICLNDSGRLYIENYEVKGDDIVSIINGNKCFVYFVDSCEIVKK
jgi:hypothetical protein